MRWAIIFTAMLASAAQASNADIIGEASGAGLQADAKRALQLLKPLDTNVLSKKDRKFVACMRARFSSPVPVHAKGPMTLGERTLAIYKTYWHAALTNPGTRGAQEKRLDAALRKLLHAPRSVDLDPLLEKKLKEQGLHSLEGRTGLLRELMIWNKQDEKPVSVALPEGNYRVKVVYLDGFRSFGWSYYATCGRASTGGWTTNDALYAVVPRYASLDGEEFRVSFLSHESQHFADKARFKDLESWELEFRAKLTEVALADTTRAKVLTRFIEDQGEDPASPHSYANRKILAELARRLGRASPRGLYTVDLARLQSTARETLLADSRRLEAAAGPRTSVQK
jgi:hypothetical protein